MSDQPRAEKQQGRGPEVAVGRGHLRPSRGQVKDGRSVVPESRLIAGRFGRMFRNLPSFTPSDELIARCVEQLLEPVAAGQNLDNPEIPSGFTYLGQFIDHDLTFDPVSSLDRQNDPDGLQNFRTPNFDLDSVYGLGPSDQPYLYQRHDPDKLLIGKRTADRQPDADVEDDLPRNADDVALIGDHRNDENIIVSQLHLAFLKLHNQIVDDIRAVGRDGRPDLRPHVWSSGDVFQEAQRLTRWHYQWVVLKEFLPRICGVEIMAELLEETVVDGGGTRRRVRDLEFYKPERSPFIPVEWSVAAYRYGHSQVRPTYNLNPFLAQVNPDIEIFIENPPEDPDDPMSLRHLAGKRRLPAFWTLDWRFFFEQNPPGTPENERVPPQPSRLIDTKLAAGLQHLPEIREGPRFLAERNLLRGRVMGLPSGQAVARRMRVRPLTPEQLGLDGEEAPLWFYILREAEVQHGGAQLGAIGGRIVAEVILGIMKEDPFSFLRTEPTWEPVLPAPIAGSPDHWGMGDLLAYAVPNDGRRFRPDA